VCIFVYCMWTTKHGDLSACVDIKIRMCVWR